MNFRTLCTLFIALFSLSAQLVSAQQPSQQPDASTKKKSGLLNPVPLVRDKQTGEFDAAPFLAPALIDIQQTPEERSKAALEGAAIADSDKLVVTVKQLENINFHDEFPQFRIRISFAALNPENGGGTIVSKDVRIPNQDRIREGWTRKWKNGEQPRIELTGKEMRSMLPKVMTEPNLMAFMQVELIQYNATNPDDHLGSATFLLKDVGCIGDTEKTECCVRIGAMTDDVKCANPIEHLIQENREGMGVSKNLVLVILEDNRKPGIGAAHADIRISVERGEATQAIHEGLKTDLHKVVVPMIQKEIERLFKDFDQELDPKQNDGDQLKFREKFNLSAHFDLTPAQIEHLRKIPAVALNPNSLGPEVKYIFE